MTTLTDQIKQSMPPDDELVIGTLASDNPLTVAVRGGTVVNPGRIGNANLNDPVALIRQDATWLMLGKVIGPTAAGLSITQVLYGTATAAVGLTAAEQDVPGTSLTFTTHAATATVIALWFADIEAIAATTGTGVVGLSLDGGAAMTPQAIFEGSVSGERSTSGQVSVLSLTPGTHTLVLRAFRSGGADAQIRTNATHTTLLLVVLQ